MKYIIYFLLLGVLAVSCQQQSLYRQSLVQAEQLMDEHPDSAYVLLKDIPAGKLPARDYAEWSLLLTQAMDKQYMIPTSDSLIRTAVTYFEKRGNAVLRAKAYYYAGRVNQDLEDTSKAQEYYLKALEDGKTSGDAHLLALIHSNLGMLYTYQNVYEDALPQMEEAVRLFLQLGDTVNHAYVLRNIGRTYHVMDSIDLAIRYYKQALENINALGRPSVLNELGDLYIAKKSFSQAELYIREALQTVSAIDYPTVCLALGCLFVETGKPDSARFYFNKCTGSSRIQTKAGAYYYLSELARKEEQWKESTEALYAYTMLLDSITQQTDAASIRKIQSLYDFKQIEEERNMALQQKFKAERADFISILTGLVLSVAYFFWWRKFQKHKKERDKLIRKYQEQLEQVTIIMEKEKLMMEMFKNTEIYKRLNQKGKEILTNEEKDKLYATIDELWPEFRYSLKTLSSKVTEEEIKMCCLLKTHQKQVKIASMLSIRDTAISNRRDSLAKKLFGDRANKHDLDNFIFSKKVPVWV